MSPSKSDFYRAAKDRFRFDPTIDYSKLKMNIIDEKKSKFGYDFIASATDGSDQEWWVIGGTTLIMHFRKSQFPDLDSAYIFHIGILSKILEHNPDGELDDDCYHVFVSYASEDRGFVQEMVNELAARGLRVWWDEDELLVGDNTRAAIENGLARSAYGAAVISPNSIDKPWPTDERGSLYSRQNSMDSTTVLPIWRGLSSKEIQNKMPMEANTHAIVVDDDNAEKAADELFQSILTRARNEAKDALKGQSDSSSTNSEIDDLLVSHQVTYVNPQMLNVNVNNNSEIQTAIDRIENTFETHRAENIDEDSLHEFVREDRFLVQGSLHLNPLGKVTEFLDTYGGWSEIESDTKEDQMFVDQLRGAAGFYQMETSGTSGGFIMQLSDDDLFEEIEQHREYTVFGEVDRVYAENEQESYMKILDDATDIPDRNERAKMDVSLRQGANAISDIPQIGNVSKSDFFISHPDIRTTPIIVYR